MKCYNSSEALTVEYDECLHFYCTSKLIDNLVLTSSWTPIQEPSIITFFFQFVFNLIVRSVWELFV